MLILILSNDLMFIQVMYMKTSLFLAVFFLIFNNTFGQNLVPDPSFEGTGACATGNLRAPWQRPSGSFTTPDLFHTCAFPSTGSCSSRGIPMNMGGTTNPAHSGNAYVGIVDVYDLGAPNGREYIQVQLTSPLMAGQRYNIGFWILRPDSTKYATDGKGMYLSTTPTPQAGNQFIPVTPQIISGVIMDANNWTLVSGIYTASGGEEWLTIGNFYDDATTNIQPTGTGATNGCILITDAAYYFIDDVFVEAHILLPLKQFEVLKTAQSTSLLSWELANVDSYQEIRIQRSRNGIDFETIEKLKELVKIQEWEDRNPLGGNNYYRLEMVLKAETVEYSTIKVVHYSKVNQIVGMLYPNPFTNQININLVEGVEIESIEVALFSMLGQPVSITSITTHSSQKLTILLEESLPKGMYTLMTKVGNNSTYQKVLKK